MRILELLNESHLLSLEGGYLFHSQSVMLDDFHQLENRVWARNCASVLLSLSFWCAFSQTPFSSYKFAHLSKEVVLCFQPAVLSCLRGAARSKWIWLKIDLLRSKGSGRYTAVVEET